MRVLLHGEGVTDCGARNWHGDWDEGPVQVLMRKIVDDLDIVCVNKADIKVPRSKLQRSLRGLSGHGVVALILAHEAKVRGFGVAALYRDADRNGGSDARKEHECRKRHNEIIHDIYQGFEQSRCNLRYIAIVPMKMIENWLLSDPNSYVKAFGGNPPDLPNTPELIWGDEKNPHSNHPKRVISRVLGTYGEKPNRESFCMIAKYIDIDTLRSKCYISFETFFKQMASI